jgi:hypothetical protein
VIAVEDCELSFIRQEAFAQLVEQKPEIFRYLVNVLAARLREADQALAAASFLTVKARGACALVALGELFGKEQGADHIVIRYKIKPERSGGHGRDCARKRQPSVERLEEAQDRHALVGLLAPGRYRRAQAKHALLTFSPVHQSLLD